MSRVWVAHDRGEMDFSGALKHGKLVRVFTGEFNPFELLQPMRYVRDLMRQQSTSSDWLILCGNSLACALLAVEYSKLWHKLPVLVWHARRKEYVTRSVPGLPLYDTGLPDLSCLSCGKDHNGLPCPQLEVG